MSEIIKSGIKESNRSYPPWSDLQSSLLTRWPLELATGEEVDVEMRNGFSAVGAVVDDQTKTVFGEAFLFGDLRGGQEEVSEDGLIGGLGFGYASDRLAGNDEVVDGCLRRDVLEADAEIVFVDDVRRDLAIADFFKKRLFSHGERRIGTEKN